MDGARCLQDGMPAMRVETHLLWVRSAFYKL